MIATLSRSGIILIVALSTTGASLMGGDEDDPNRIVDPTLFQAMEYRLIGPFRGGRVTAVTGVPSQAHTFYMGSTGGGVWKTTDGGGSWKNVSDGFFEAGSIGAIAVSRSDRNVVYAGTGSACPRGNVSPGIGIYRSTDAGQSWEHVGLRQAGQIAKLAIHPEDPHRVYAAVLGNVFGPNPERGVFRTLDGGKTWEKVLFVDERTGAVDLAMDPNNPRILYAAMWQVERKPWTLIDGGPGGGVFKSFDGGANWKKLQGGLPEGVLGRIGVAVAANSERVWVIVETDQEEEGGVYRSDDSGKSWKRVSRNRDLRGRAWYYNHIIADPQNLNTVYVMNAGFHKSVDGGRNWERIRVPHGDNHDLWIHPDNPEIMINSNDGGANVSYNGGRSWSSQSNQPTAEFYRVTVDDQFPYRVYGAQQDNSTISLPSTIPGGITPEQHWEEVGGGESGHIAVDPRNPRVVYAGNYIGQITRLDLDRGHRRDVVAYPQMHDGLAGKDIKYRFQWNAPIRISRHDPNLLYHTSQFVHVSGDEGQSWKVISPDLTTNRAEYQEIPGGPIQHDHTGVELYTTIFAFEESPHQAGLLWAGTDDGRVHLTRDGGRRWVEITPRDMPQEGTVNTIELSKHDPGRAFIAVYRYRRNDFQPYIFRTDDYGAHWKRLTDGSNGIPDDHFVRVVREDPDQRGLLYAGTEFGMYVSFDDGAHWQSLQLNLPRTPITDLAVHRKDLVVATQGRSFWILDDLGPLHELAQQAVSSDLHLFQPRPAYRTQMRGFRDPAGPQNPPRGAILYAYFAEKPKEAVEIEILDASGSLIRAFKGSAEPADTDSEEESTADRIEIETGMNRYDWDLNYAKPDLIEKAVFSLSYTGGFSAPPGLYQVRLKVGEWSQTRSLRVMKDPRWEASDEDLLAQFELTRQIHDQLEQTHQAIRTIRSIREQANAMAKRAVEAGHGERIEHARAALSEKLDQIEQQLIQTRSEGRQDPINYPPRLDNQLAYLYTKVNGQDARPTAGSYELFSDLNAQLAVQLDRLQEVRNQELQKFTQLLDEEGVPRIVLPPKK